MFIQKTKRFYAMVTGTISILIEQSLVVNAETSSQAFSRLCHHSRQKEASDHFTDQGWHIFKRIAQCDAAPGRASSRAWRPGSSSRLRLPPVSAGGQGGGGEHMLRDHQTGLRPAPDLPLTIHAWVLWDYFFSCTMGMTIFLFGLLIIEW